MFPPFSFPVVLYILLLIPLSLLDEQVTTLPDEFPEAHLVVNDLRLEYVVAVEGVVRRRPIESINRKMKTGFVEVNAFINIGH